MAKNRGQPTKYTKALGDIICEELGAGISLRTVCKAENMPAARTVHRWIRTNKHFCQQYARAKEESADAMAEDVLDIADDTTGDIIDGVFVQRAKLRIDTRKWLMSKMKPKKYGDKLALAGDDTAPLSIIVKLPGDKPS